MVQILAGEKGEGKTKKLIAMANEAGKSANGSVVFVDDDNSRMYDLHYSVRFVDTPKFIMEDPQVFIEELEKTSAEAETDMIMIISRKQDLLPAEVQKYLV